MSIVGDLQAHCYQNNPLHISLFPPDERAPLEYQFLLSSCLDIFEARLPHKTADQDFGLLQAVDERLAMYGWLTNTGVKIVIVVDMEGKPANAADSRVATAVGLRDADLKPVCSQLSIAAILLIINRHLEHCKQHTLCFCGTPSIALMSILQSQQMLSRRLARPRLRAGSSFRK